MYVYNVCVIIHVSLGKVFLTISVTRVCVHAFLVWVWCMELRYRDVLIRMSLCLMFGTHVCVPSYVYVYAWCVVCVCVCCVLCVCSVLISYVCVLDVWYVCMYVCVCVCVWYFTRMYISILKTKHEKIHMNAYTRTHGFLHHVRS
jgi:hypothetical protein